MPDSSTKIPPLEAIAKRRNEFLKKNIAADQRRLQLAVYRLEERMIGLAHELKTSKGDLLGPKVNFAHLKQIHKDAVKLNVALYGEAIDKTLDGRSKIMRFIKKEFSDLDHAVEFTGLDKRTIKALNERSYSDFIAFGEDAIERTREAMFAAVVSGAPYAELLKTIEGIFVGHRDRAGKPMSRYVGTWAFDETMNFHNQVTLMKAEDAGLTSFLYMGDIIESSRPFCIARAGKVYTKKQIESWNDMHWQGKRGPAMTYRGGWRCRHHWMPVDPAWIPEGKIDVAKWGMDTREAADRALIAESAIAKAAKAHDKVEAAIKTAEAADIAVKEVGEKIHSLGEPGKVLHWYGSLLDHPVPSYEKYRLGFLKLQEEVDELASKALKIKDPNFSVYDRMKDVLKKDLGPTDELFIARDESGQLAALGRMTREPGRASLRQLIYTDPDEAIKIIKDAKHFAAYIYPEFEVVIFDDMLMAALDETATITFSSPTVKRVVFSLPKKASLAKAPKEAVSKKVPFRADKLEERNKEIIRVLDGQEETLKELEGDLKEILSKAHLYKRAERYDAIRILRDGKMKNQFETGTSGGLFNPGYRKDIENRLFGDKIKKVADKDRPIYGFLSLQEPPAPGVAASYGDVVMKLKKGVRPRTTFTASDSLSTLWSDSLARDDLVAIMPSPINDPRASSLYAFTASDDAESLFLRSSKEKVRESIQFLTESKNEINVIERYNEDVIWSPYFEIQVHGGVSVDDIEVIYCNDPPRELVEEAKKRNIPIKDYVEY